MAMATGHEKKELSAQDWGDAEVRELIATLPQLTALKSVRIDNRGCEKTIADDVKTQLYSAMQPRGGEVWICEKANGGKYTWKNGESELDVAPLDAVKWGDAEVHELMDALPRLTALKKVTIDRSCFDKTFADDVKMELYSAMQPRGGEVIIKEKLCGAVIEWKDGAWSSVTEELRVSKWGDTEVHELIHALPRLTALKKVIINDQNITDHVKMELYSAMQPRGGEVRVATTLAAIKSTHIIWVNGKPQHELEAHSDGPFYGDKEVRTLIDLLPTLTTLKKVSINTWTGRIADEVKMELYNAMRPRGGDVSIKEMDEMTWGPRGEWRNGDWAP